MIIDNENEPKGHRIEAGDATARAISTTAFEALRAGLVHDDPVELGRLDLGSDGTVCFIPASRYGF